MKYFVMKTIRLTESQLHRLIENNIVGAPNFDGGDIKEYNGNEINATTNVTNQYGEQEYGTPKTTDKVQNDLSPQNNFGLNHRISNSRIR